MSKYKRYDDLQDGDKIWWYGYKGTVRNVSKVDTVTDKANPYYGECVYRFNVYLEPSEDGIEKTIYNGGTYGGVASLEVRLQEE